MQKTRQIIITISVCLAFMASVGVVYAWTNPPGAPTACPSGYPGCDAPINVSGNAQYKSGAFGVGGVFSADNGLNVSISNGAYSNIYMRDDESVNGLKYIHANSNVIGFLSGAGSWLTYWDAAGNQQNTGGATFGGTIRSGSSNNPTWGNLIVDMANTNTVYAYTAMCVGNNNGACGGANGVVLTPSYVQFPDGTRQTTAATAGTNYWTVSGSNISNNNVGNVGIGTASPTQKLTVNGEINRAGGWRLTTAWGGDVLTLKNNAWDGSSNDNYGGLAAGHGYFYGGLQSGGGTGYEASPGQLYVGGISMLMGNVGIGTVSPTRKLQVGTGTPGGSADPDADIISSGGVGILSGKMLSLDTNYYVHAYEKFQGAGNEVGFLHYGYYGHDFQTRNGSGLVIRGDSNNVGIGTVSPITRLHVLSSGTTIYGQATGGGSIGIQAAGESSDFYAVGPGTNYGAASSIRWKENLRPIGDALKKVMSLKGLYYDWKADHGGKKDDMGMIAEEVAKIVPQVVSLDPDAPGFATGMDYGALTPLLIEAIKEQQKQIDELKAQIEELKRK